MSTRPTSLQDFRATPRPTLRASAIALQATIGLLAGSDAARAEVDAAWTALVQPRHEAELGLTSASGYNAKAEEYSGLRDRGPALLGSIDLRGGGAYDSDDTRRWRIQGTRLGTRSPSLDAEVGRQGSWRLTLGFDQLWRNTSDSFQTPYQGIGSTVLTLPGNWVPVTVPRLSATAPNARGLSPEVTASPAIVNGALTAPTTAQTNAAAAMQAADLGAFNRVDLFTERTRHALGFTQQLGTRWTVDAGFSREHKQGLRAQGAPSRATGGDTSALLPLPIDQDDTQFHLGLAYAGDGLQVQARYEDSLFANHVPGLTWTLWAAPTLKATQATAPSNRFSKLSLSGSLHAGPATTLTAAVSTSRSTQNDAYLTDTTAPWVPVASAQARVVGDTASLKLQHRATGRLNLGAHVRYELRDNRTPVNLYGFYDLNNPATGSSPFAYLFPSLTNPGQNLNINANTPYSRRSQQVGVDADWRFASLQRLTLGWDSQRTARWCNGSWINCADATQATEHTLRADWSATLDDTLSVRAGAAAARRKVDYDENAFLAVVPMAGQTPSTATGALAGSTAYSALTALGLTGYGPVSGLAPAAAAGTALAFYFPANNVLSNVLYANQNRISELVGMRRYNQADRDRQTLRGSLQWQPGERLSVQAGLDLRLDDYRRSVYGLQRLAGQTLNLDGRYAVDERWSVGLFGSLEQQRTRAAGNTYTANSAAVNVNGATAIDGGCFATIAARNAANKIDPCLDWTTRTTDHTLTLGLNAEVKQLLAGKLDLFGSLVWSDARVDTDGTGGSYVNNPYAGVAGAASRDTAAFYVPFAALPTVTVRSLQLGLGGTARLNERQSLRVVYNFQRLRSADWAYEGLQDGGLNQMLPSREQAPAYDIHRLGVSWLLGF